MMELVFEYKQISCLAEFTLSEANVFSKT